MARQFGRQPGPLLSSLPPRPEPPSSSPPPGVVLPGALFSGPVPPGALALGALEPRPRGCLLLACLGVGLARGGRARGRAVRLRPSAAVSDFEARVRRVVLSTRPGDVVTYGEVAVEAGRPGAARVTVLDRSFDADLGAAEIKTWRVPRDGEKPVTETDLLEW